MNIENLFNVYDAPLDGKNLVEASAGTGKTHSLVELYVKILLGKKNTTVERILAVTYTDAAAAELKIKIRSRLAGLKKMLSLPGESWDGFPGVEEFKNDSAKFSELKLKIDSAANSIDDASIFTIHGFCYRILKEHYLESAFLYGSELIKSESDLIGEISADFFRREFFNSGKHLVEYLVVKNYTVEYLKRISLTVMQKIDCDIRPKFKGKKSSAAAIERIISSFEKLRETYIEGSSSIREILESSKNKLAANKFPRKPIGQILDFLTSFFEGGFDLASIYEAVGTLKYFRESFLKDSGVKKSDRENFNYHDFFKETDNFFDEFFRFEEEMNEFIIFKTSEFIDFLRVELDHRKDLSKKFSFTDILKKVHSALKVGGGEIFSKTLSEKYDAVLVDEFQDTDGTQYDIFMEAFGGNTSCFFIGDPKQSIYSFRGADVHSYFRCYDDIPAERRFKLTTNWRSSEGLIASQNALFSGKNPFYDGRIEYSRISCAQRPDRTELVTEGDPSSFVLWLIKNAKDTNKKLSADEAKKMICECTASEIASMLLRSNNGNVYLKKNGEKTPIRPGNFAIIVRNHSEADRMKSALNMKGIPAITYGEKKVFQTLEMSDVRLIVKAVIAPFDASAVLTALSTPLYGSEISKIEELSLNSEEMGKVQSRFDDYRRMWEKSGFMSFMSGFLYREGIYERTGKNENGPRRLVNVLHIVEILNRVSLEQNLGPIGLLNWMTARMDPNDTDGNDEYQIRLESEDDAVEIMTVHRSKGLEFDIVFAPFHFADPEKRVNIVDGVFYHDKAENGKEKVVYDLNPSEETKKFAKQEIFSEELRLLYVALTRAKFRCYTAWGKISSSSESAMAYILHGKNLPAEDFGDHVEGLSYEELKSECLRFAVESGGAISVLEPEIDTRLYYKKSPIGKKLEQKFVDHRIKDDFVITSYSYMVNNEIRDDDTGLDEPEINYVPASTEDKDREANLVGFPFGAAAGNCLHKILELIGPNDFSLRNKKNEINNIIEETISMYGFDESLSCAVFDMLNKVFSARINLFDEDFSLFDVHSDDFIKEMEFYFPVEKLILKDVKKFFEQKGFDYLKLLDPQKKDISGFLKGYIDAVFRHKNKYFIIDWKSNYLGDSLTSYSRKNLELSMINDLYFLQAFIYATAVHRHLKNSLPGYSYEKNFGGVMYFYLRGVGFGTNGEQYGIYGFRPDQSVLKQMSSFFNGGEMDDF